MAKYKPLTKEERQKKEKEELQEMADLWIEGIKNSNMPWQKPWKAGTYEYEFNPLSTQEHYNGLNEINLFLKRMKYNLTDTRWCTFAQIIEHNRKLKDKKDEIFVEKGAKGTAITYYTPLYLNKENKWVTEKPLDIKNEDLKTTMVLKKYIVFNVQQMFKKIYDENNNVCMDENGNFLKKAAFPPLEKKVKDNEIKPHIASEELIKNSNAKILHDQVDRNFYSPLKDEIHLVNRNNFKSTEDYYETALHELVHWTGHEKRLNRDMGKSFGSEKYAKEELIAEIGSYFLAKENKLSFSPSQNHFAYVKSWLNAIKDDPNIIFESINQANKAKNFIFDCSYKNVHKNSYEKENIEIKKKGR